MTHSKVYLNAAGILSFHARLSVHKDVSVCKTICVPCLEKFHNICLILCYIFNK